jgi:hypothetical protein
MSRVCALLAIVLTQSVAPPAFDVTSLTVAAPTLVCELDLNQLKGELRRLSWSPDGRSIHLQTAAGPDADARDYIVTVTDGVVSLAFGEPEWAAQYWAMKSSLAAPGVPSLRLEVQLNNRRTRPTPFGGGTANGGAYTPDVKNPVDAFESEVTLRLQGLELGSWINDAPMAGDTFGWGPPASAAIVYVGRGDRLTLMDQEKRRTVVATVKGAAFPAWSTDGTRLAFVQRTGRKKYRLMVAAVRRANL